jgi:hypothetical protein
MFDDILPHKITPRVRIPAVPPKQLRWAPKLRQELAGVKIESRRFMMPGYAARSLVLDGITSPA